jgi:hypothetical protein
MKKVSSEEVAYELALGQQEKIRKDDDFKDKFFSGDSELRRSLAKCMEKSWKEIFLEEEVVWYETELSFDTEFVNRIFDSGKGFMRDIGMTNKDLEKEYASGKMNVEFRDRIDSIRKRKSRKNMPRVIVLTNDMKTYVILDGARRALALRLEKKSIPVYLGYKKEFKSLRHFN